MNRWFGQTAAIINLLSLTYYDNEWHKL